MKILHRYTQAELFSDDSPTMADTVLAAIKAKVNLRGSDLSGSDLSGSNLRYSDLSGSDLRGSNLRYSDLSGSNLRYSDLRGSNLRYSNLSGSNLSGSNLSGSNLSPTIIFDIGWGTVSDALCLEMMRYDAANHPNPKAFDKWAKDPTSGCPYTGTGITRMLYFQENPKRWKRGRAKSAYELMVLLFAEKGIKWGRGD